jgi:MFS family permease
VHALAPVFALTVLAGLCLAPMISCQFSLVGALAPEGTVTEAFTWHRAATVAGMAGGSALGGSLIDAHGPSGAFALGCVGVAAAAALAVVGRRRITPVAPGMVASGPPAVEGLAPPAAIEELAAVAVAEGPVPFKLAAEAVALAVEALSQAGEDSPACTAERPARVMLAAEAVALAAEAVAQSAV